MLEVITAQYVGGYRIRVRFNNGREGVVDLADVLWGPMFEPLRDVAAFRRFQVSDVLHTIRWDNDADLAPEFLLQRLGEPGDASAAEFASSTVDASQAPPA
ncbi:MAG: DUF2442 domain-containing protein, partial [Patescibacteria group bacterium]|nr:DUF2442 domain-containing protein [Patescibacteria group bacterium]